MRLVHYNDEKQKWQSHEIYLQEDIGFYHYETGMFTHDIRDIRGYGKTKEEALSDFKEKLDWLFEEYRALEKMIFETDVLTDNMVEVDYFGKEVD